MPLFSRIPIDKRVVETAIQHLERQTSAELRVYIERMIPNVAANRYDEAGVKRAFELFEQLEMNKTAQHNAVLIYLAYKHHFCWIIGDEGIHRHVGDAFWQSVYDEMLFFFKKDQYTQGLVRAIECIGKELKRYYPIDSNDKDELPNEVIINDS